MSGAVRISVVLIARDEAHLLRDCLESVKWADEIVVLDMQSGDDTADVCARYSARRVPIEKQDLPVLARNVGFAEATGDWVLVLDPDERVPKALARKIRELVTDADVSAYAIPRKNLIFGLWAKTMAWWPDAQTRLFRAGCVSYQGRVHEAPVVGGAVQFLPPDPTLALVHVNYTSLSQFVEKLNRYTSAIAMDLNEAGVRFRWWKLLYRPVREFVKRFLYHGGFRQGVFGLLLSALMGFYELISWAKLWELQKPDTPCGTEGTSVQ